jgi:hypothetical protein
LDVRNGQRHGRDPAGTRVGGSSKGVILTGCYGEAKGALGARPSRPQRRFAGGTPALPGKSA